MSKHSSTEHQGISDSLSGFDAEPASFRRALDAISHRIPAAQVLLTSTFPRGGSVVLHPATAPENFLRIYAKEGFTYDGPTWQAVMGRGPVTGNHAVASGSLEGSDYYRNLMQPHGWAHVAAARVPGPVFKG